MHVAEMHYGFKQGLNRKDSDKYQDLLVPEIDVYLNDAMDVFIKVVANPRQNKAVGFEIGQRTTDDIRTIVVNQKYGDGVAPSVYNSVDFSYIAPFPDEYYYYLGTSIYGKVGDTIAKMRRAIPMQHNDESEVSLFYKSSFNWREVNIEFINEGLLVYTDGSFSISKVCFNYLKKPKYIHYAEGFNGQIGYSTFDGVQLVGFQNCELPDSCHRDIVDIAVFLAASDLNMPDYQNKQRKLGITN